MNKITPLEAYATTDGKLFPNKIEAEAHQHAIDITPEVDAYLGDTKLSIDYFARRCTIIHWEEHRKLVELKGVPSNDVPQKTCSC